MTMNLPDSISRSFIITAADCNAQLELSIPPLVKHIIDVATAHADILDVGHARLSRRGISWVLMRLSMQLRRMPCAGETFTLTTWVESFNRRFSERDFEITVAGGEAIGHVKTIWSTINSATRQAASLDGLEALAEVIVHHEDVLWSKGPRVRPADFAEGLEGEAYRVAVSDIDSNRHLTSQRYFELMLNMWPLDFYDKHVITRFEIAFSNEARYGQTVMPVRLDLPGGRDAAVALRRGDDILSLATLSFIPRS